MAMKLVKPPVVKWNGSLVKENVLEDVTYQAFEKYGGNSNYKGNGIEWLLLKNNVCFEKDDERVRVTKSQLKPKYKSTRASLASYKEMLISHSLRRLNSQPKKKKKNKKEGGGASDAFVRQSTTLAQIFT